MLLGLGICQGRCTVGDQIGALALSGHDEQHSCLLNGVNLWKYVDDTSMAETVHKGQPRGIQVAVDDLVRQAKIDKFQLNETKCEELQISFSRSVDPLEAGNNKPIEVVTSVKLLGLTISNNLKWSAHI